MRKIFTVLFMTLILAGSASAQEKRFAMSTPKAVEGNVSKFEAGAFASELQKALTNNGYRVVARGPAVDAIIKDFDFESNSSLTDNEKAKLAQLKNVDYICMPAVMEKNGIYYFSATVIDKELGEFVAVVSAFLKNFSDIDSACEQMAGEILSYLGASSGNDYTRLQPPYHDGNGSSRSGAHADFTENAWDINMKMVWVEGGDFMMGCTSEQGNCDDDEQNVRRVTVDGYWIGMLEVTQAQWEKVMGTSIYQQKNKANSQWSVYGVGPDYPMYYVSWDEAMEFCRLLSQKTGKTYTLPTEAQWEYAARGGNKADGTKYAGSNMIDAVAWYTDNSGNSTHPVGTKRGNALGIYDMSGNVWEWCKDWYSNSYVSYDTNNPTGPSSGSFRVSRGGSWDCGASYCRVSNRSGSTPDHRGSTLGFRVVLVP